MAYDLISLKTLKELSTAGAVRSAQAVGIPGGFAVQFTYGLATKTLQARRGHPRVFKTLDAAAKTVRSVGLARLEADLADWRPEQKPLADPADQDRARQQFRKALTTIRRRAAALSDDEVQQLAEEAVAFARRTGRTAT